MEPLFTSQLQADLQAIRDRLTTAIGKFRDELRLDPTSQFVYAFLSSRTLDGTSRRVFTTLLERYRHWDAVADAPAGDIEKTIHDVTFAERKAPDLRLALRKIRARAGSLDLEFLADLSIEAGLFWLEQIHGVGRKIAAATLNFSTLRKRAFVVDTHIVRIMQRFGFVGPSADIATTYEAVMAAAEGLDADDLYELHWQLKDLGQKTCTHSYALCGSCPLTELCLKRIEPTGNAA